MNEQELAIKTIHLQKCFRDMGHKTGGFPHAEEIGAEELSLPIFPEITGEQIECVVKALENAV